MNKINLVILACISVSLFYWFSGADVPMTKYLAFSGENLLQGKVWTVLTGLFLHGNVVHLAGNMLFLFVFGTHI